MTHPIEKQSYEILSSQFDFSQFSKLETQVVKRIIHATADFELAKTVTFSAGAVESASRSLKSKPIVVCDVEMVRAGITKYPTECYLSKSTASNTGFPTRSFTAMSLAAEMNPQEAVFVIGCAPTALDALLELEDNYVFQPILIIGIPVGFVGAAESKLKLKNSRFPFITNDGDKGGSPAASAAFNAIYRISKEDI